MGCNKEDATKAMQLAERKMQDNDFTGARKMAQKAQQLFPGLENISQLLAVCDIHCSAENKLGGCEMDWYGILQVQRFSHEAIIKKQVRKLGLLLHPDKNKFAGAVAAFKLIGEANTELEDRGRHFRYDMKCRALLRTGEIPSAHQFDENLFLRKHTDAARNAQSIPQSQYASMNEHQKGQSDTFSTCCPFCKTAHDCSKDSANRLLHCQRCRRLFVASDFGNPGMHPETLRNQFADHSKLPNQIPLKVASNHDGAGNSPVKRIQTEKAASNPVSKVEVAADVDGGASNTGQKYTEHGVAVRMECVEISKYDSVKSKDSGPSRNLNIKGGNSIGSVGSVENGNGARPNSEHVILEKVSIPSELNGSPHICISLMKKNLSYSGDDDDFVNPPKWSGKSPLSSATEKKRKSASVYGGCGSLKNDRSPYSAAASLDRHKEKALQKLSFRLEECLPSKKSKTGEPVPDDDEANFKPDVSPVADVDVTSTRGAIEIPDPQFHKCAVDADSLPSLVKANQIWALYDQDGMPRWYAFVKKVVTPGFKLKIIWLEPNPCDQGEIDWCEKELPVVCGKFKLGDTDKIKDRLSFSHMMDYTKGRDRNSILVYPRKGETWAIYQNWDIGWSSELEKHMPYKYEFVEVLTDFVEADGIGVRYLGKVRGFVSLFQQTEQHGVVMFQVPPHELYRFSHRIPSFKMTGCEGHGVPPGSFELDPASLPTSIFNVSDPTHLEMDDRSKKTETDGMSRGRVGSVTACTAAQV